MPELTRKSALAGRAPMRAGGCEIIPWDGIAACLVTSRTPIDLSGAIRISPGELLYLEDGADPDALRLRIAQGVEGTVLVQDITAALAFIVVQAPDPLDFLGLGALDIESAATARLADLRVTLVRRGTALLLVAERPAAAYLWEWLKHRLDIAAAATPAQSR
ncbi:hypothetical protein [Sphingosinicella soli]|uniref:Sarcosine oxidase subunit gamma n=1 Tax=Sphingosinicella soli TaxID=333708 RepID=A0A7W7B477_9SPHN|nr:hypothetical protein [Sphingosinicella soli]MBB4633716.1 hypothetical protein [Sphingosinicella soli]